MGPVTLNKKEPRVDLSKPFCVVAIDPGFCTGVCRVRIDPGFSLGGVAFAKEIPWDQRFSLYQLPAYYPKDVFIMESFRVYPHKAQDLIGSDMPSCQVIGIVEAALYHAGKLDQLVYQQAIATKGVKIPPDFSSVFGSSEHMKDAFKHIRYWAAFRKNKFITRRKNERITGGS